MSLNCGNLYIISGISYIIHTFSGFVGNKKTVSQRTVAEVTGRLQILTPSVCTFISAFYDGRNHFETFVGS